jgi:hypothetical protein
MNYDNQSNKGTQTKNLGVTKQIRVIHRVFVGLVALSAIALALCFSSINKQTVEAQTLSANIAVLYNDSIDNGVYVTKIDQPIVFDGTGSTGYGTFSMEPHEWNFGDGFNAKIIRATHTYRVAGTYTVSLTVRNSSQTNTATVTVRVDDITAPSQKLCVGSVSETGCTATYSTIQAAVNQAATQNGSSTIDIVLPAGTTFIERVLLTNPTGNNYITIRSDKVKNLTRGRRVDRSDLSNFTTMLTPQYGIYASYPAITARNTNGVPTHHYRLQGIQFKMQGPPVGIAESGLVEFGNNNDPCDADENPPICLPQNTESRVPHHLIVDRCLFYDDEAVITNGNPPVEYCVKRGIYVNAKIVSIVDSHFSNINWPTIESKAIGSANGTRAFSAINNYLESGSVQILFGGVAPLIPNYFATDVEFRRNRSHKPLEKKNLPPLKAWLAKNNFEIKAGQYFVIEGNMFDGNWVGGDQNYTVNFNALAVDTGTQTKIEDVQFSNNIIKECPSGIFMSKNGALTDPARILEVVLENATRVWLIMRGYETRKSRDTKSSQI